MLLTRRVSQELIELISILVLGGIPCLIWMAGQVYALSLPNRSVVVSSAEPSAIATHTFQMTFSSSATLGSIEFEYCTTPLPTAPCVPPTGLSLAQAMLSSQSGNTGFSIDSADSTASTLILSRTPAAANDVPSSYVFSNVTNPSDPGQAIYIRLSTYSTSDATGSSLENAAVAFSTTSNFQVGASVPPFLNLCVGITVADNCKQVTDNSIDLGTLSSASTAEATSQVAAATNSDSGYGLFVLGTTMTSGNNIIPAASSPATSHQGSGQFGINLRKNTAPPIGFDPSGDGSAAPAYGYNNPNLFSFVSGTQIANSSLPTDYNLMTVSYIVNVENNQPAGIYSTTLTYLASAQF
jgi:hypothetical protein